MRKIGDELVKLTRDLDELFEETLPALARHFDGKALTDLKQANPWLAIFEPDSKLTWQEAKDAFLVDGPAVLDTLASLTELIRFESGIGIILSRDVNISTQLLLAIRQDYESDSNIYGTIENQVLEMSAELTKNTLGAGEESGIAKARIEALLKTGLEADGNIIWHWKTQKARTSVSEILFGVVWNFLYDHNGSPRSPFPFKTGDHDDKDTVQSCFVSYTMDVMDAFYDLQNTYVWQNYSRKIQSFVRQVGCARVHQEPDENIAELRLFHSMTVGYFAKLQQQYVEKELEIKKLRHYISALELRHLLEHLPDIGLHKDAGPRWQIFWENALHDEAEYYLNGQVRAEPHALKSLVEKRNQKRAFLHPDGAVPGPNGSNRVMVIHKEGQNGLLYRTGRDLYSTLSDEIHNYRGEKFHVEDDDGWTKVVTEVLCALKPLDDNINNTEVQWDQERLRYVLRPVPRSASS
ncbi:MAG: hypothetical protein Q9195_004845 [Heterodermia aff. obscurata]